MYLWVYFWERSTIENAAFCLTTKRIKLIKNNIKKGPPIGRVSLEN